MSSIRASMEGELPELAEKLSRLSTIDKAGINNAIAEALRSGTIERFEGEKSPEGAAWNKSIRASEKGGLTLTMTGQLKGSINARATEEGAEVGTKPGICSHPPVRSIRTRDPGEEQALSCF